MKNLFYTLLSLTIIGAIALPVYASTLPGTPSVFETYLASPMSTSDTSMSIASAALRDGTTLSGYQCFTIDTNTPTLEYVCGTVSGTSVTSLTRGLGAVNGTSTYSALTYSHRRGADVKITDYPVLTLIQRILSGIDTIAQPISYLNTIATTTLAADRNFIPSVGLLQDTAFNGAGVINASTNAKGIVQIATGLQTASSTSAGSSGALLVIPSSLATSTYNVATAPLKVVVTQNNGKIDTNFLATSTALLTNLALTGTTTINGNYAYGLLNVLDMNNLDTATSTTFAYHDYLKVNVYGSTTASTEDYCLVLNGDYNTSHYTVRDPVLGTGCTNGVGGIHLSSGLGAEKFWWTFEVQNATGTTKMIRGTGMVYLTNSTILYATSTAIYADGVGDNPITRLTITDGGANQHRLTKAYARTYSDDLQYSTP